MFNSFCICFYCDKKNMRKVESTLDVSGVTNIDSASEKREHIIVIATGDFGHAILCHLQF